MILSKNDDCPMGKVCVPTSPKCKECRNFIKQEWYDAYGMYGLFCEKAVTDADRINYLDK